MDSCGTALGDSNEFCARFRGMTGDWDVQNPQL